MDKNTLSPIEAAHIAANAYFTLEGWAERYKFNKEKGSGAAPSVLPKAATPEVVRSQVIGAGPQALPKAGINNGQLVNSFSATTGSNLFGRTKSGFGYVLKFTRNGKKHLVFATRGTRPEMGYPDLLTDANMGLNRHIPDIGPVHAGFYDTYKSLWPAITDAKAELDAADFIHCVGHSLGGAVANLIALKIVKSQKGKVKLYTFGAPRVGLRRADYDKVANRFIGKNNIYRVSHNFDIIPMIPVAPYIHVHPSVLDENNFFLGSPIKKPSMGNHDTDEYIKTVGTNSWSALRSNKLEEGYLDKQFFNSWRTSDSWFKRQVGHSLNATLGVFQRILQGLIDAFGKAITQVVTVLDLLVIAIREGINIFQVGKSYITKFLQDCVRVFGLGADMSKKVLTKLYRKLKAQIEIEAKLALETASTIAKSQEFKTILKASSVGTIGLMLM